MPELLLLFLRALVLPTLKITLARLVNCGMCLQGKNSESWSSEQDFYPLKWHLSFKSHLRTFAGAWVRSSVGGAPD